MTPAQQILQYVVTGVTLGSIYALIGMGFNIIYNATGIINFAQGEFVMLGALLTLFSLSVLHLPIPFAALFAVLAVAAFGALFDRLAIRPLRDASPITLIIITVGASILIRGLAMFAWGKDSYPVPPFSGEEPIAFFGAVIQPQNLWVLGVTIMIVMALRRFFSKTLTGKAMIACAVQRRAARLVGIETSTMVLLSFAVSGGVGAAAGVVISPISMAQYDMGVMLGLKGFCAAIIGGLGVSWGAVAGGFLLGLLESLGAGLISSGYKDAIAFIVLLLMLFLRPQGLLGSTRSDRV